MSVDVRQVRDRVATRFKWNSTTTTNPSGHGLKLFFFFQILNNLFQAYLVVLPPQGQDNAIQLVRAAVPCWSVFLLCIHRVVPEDLRNINFVSWLEKCPINEWNTILHITGGRISVSCFCLWQVFVTCNPHTYSVPFFCQLPKSSSRCQVLP